MNFKECLESYTQTFSMMETEQVEDAIAYLKQFQHRIYLVGNGGSLALANHFAHDLVKTCDYSAFALTDPCMITAIGNDVAFENIFVDQLANHLTPDDCLIAFSSSGNSKNIINACKFAEEFGDKVISFTGFSGGKVKELSEIAIHVPVFDYGIVETIHSLIFHHIIERVK